MHLKNVTLELSSKPFRDESEATMYAVCRRMFTQWKPLTDAADAVSVMLWTSDGSEIFEYSGDLSQTFEWAYWAGCANHTPCPENATERQKHQTHHYPVKVVPDAGPRSYAWLKRLIEVVRETGAEIARKPIRIGATYDNGPEFAISNFKYRKHPESCLGHTMFANSVVTCTARFHADSERYAAYPDGIPEGTSVGTFLAKQYKAMEKDLGFDYLWLSNGMGFGTETWGITGMLFDKHAFHPEKAGEAAELMLSFWKDFFDAYPECVVETRGSNCSAGLEIATDACPIRELYGKYRIAPPVNSPWAALNFNTGLEIVAWMSHIAELPDDRLPFRYYIHDPWFCNSPWLDRYAREPWDLYPVLAVSRIDDNGRTVSANSVALLSVDSTWGEQPDQVPHEVIPHLFEAFDHAPDRPSPLVWVYPFDEYTDHVRGANPRPDIVFTEEMFIGECVQEGLPLNTVVSTRIFRRLTAEKNPALKGKILVVPVSAADGANMDALEAHLASGGKILFYGVMQGAPERVKALLQLRADTAISGDVAVETRMKGDGCPEEFPSTVHILPQYSCGGLTEVPAEGASFRTRAVAHCGGEERVVALSRRLENGAEIGFVRAVLPASNDIWDGRNFDYAKDGEIFPVLRLLRDLAGEFGWRFGCVLRSAESKVPRTSVSRHDNAFFFSIYAPDTTAEMHVNTPYGVPLVIEGETWIDGSGNGVWHPEKSWRKECRCFVKQSESSVVSLKLQPQSYPYYSRCGHLMCSGLKNAEIRFFPPLAAEETPEVVCAPDVGVYNIFDKMPVPLEWEHTPDGPCIVVRNVSGRLMFSMVART